jgi:hypothetical protein
MPKKDIVLINEQLLLDTGAIGYDVFRQAAGGEWAVAPRGNIKFAKARSADFKIESISKGRAVRTSESASPASSIPTPGPDEPHTSIDPVRESEEENARMSKIPGLEPFRQKITLVDIGNSETNDITARENWESLINSLVSGGRKLDYVTKLDGITTTEELLSLRRDTIAPQGGVEYVYNYHDRPYEKLLRRVRDVKLIPNVYTATVDSLLEEKERANKPGFSPSHTLPTRPDTMSKDPNTTPVESATAQSLKRNIRSRRRRGEYENQLVPIENTGFLLRYEGNKNLFPMYCEMQIPLDRNNEFAQAVKDSDIGCILMRDLQEIVSAPSYNVRTETIHYSFPTIQDDGSTEVTNFSTSAKVMDVFTWENEHPMLGAYWPALRGGWWAEDAAGWGGGEPLPGGFTYVGPEMRESSLLADERHPAKLAIGLNNFYNGLESIVRQKRRTFRDLLRGKESYSETLLYKITKYKGRNLDNPIQTFHFFADGRDKESTTEDLLLSFIDTQVKYNQQYTYVGTAYQIVVGSEYEYSNLETYGPIVGGLEGRQDQRAATFDITIAPSIKIIEVPFFVSSGKIVDNPPLEPEVKFIPIKGRPNILKMHFETGTGVADLEPIAFTDAEAEDYDQIAFNQKRTDGQLTFRADDGATAFRIYRVAKPPVSYDDFANSLLVVARTMVNSGKVNFDASSVTKIIRQTPNKKFYYIFRTEDFHGHISIPSPVYEIELYNDGGAGYPIIRQYEFGSINPKTTIKSARKLIQIVPRFTQAFLNEEASRLIDEEGEVRKATGRKGIILGLEDESLFGKRFKIRLTSRDTGKKVDLNVDFKTKRIRSEIE